MRTFFEILGPVVFAGVGYTFGDWFGLLIGLVIYLALRCGAFEALAHVFD